MGDRTCLSGDFIVSPRKTCCSGGDCWGLSLGFSSCSSISRTSDILGRRFLSMFRQRTARVATAWAAFWGYCPSSFVSIIRNTFRLSSKYGLAHSTRFCSTPTFILSRARRPDNSSSNTTPKLYTSLFAVSRPTICTSFFLFRNIAIAVDRDQR